MDMNKHNWGLLGSLLVIWMLVFMYMVIFTMYRHAPGLSEQEKWEPCYVDGKSKW